MKPIYPIFCKLLLIVLFLAIANSICLVTFNKLIKLKRFRIAAVESFNENRRVLNIKSKVSLDSLGYMVNKNALKSYLG